MMHIADALVDPNWFGAAFPDPESWAAWRAILRAVEGLPLSPADRAVFDRLAGGRAPPERPVSELIAIKGRRSGGSRIGALLACSAAGRRDWREVLAPGERASCVFIACDRDQAALGFRYASELVRGSAVLAPLIERETATTIELSNGAEIVVVTNSFRSVRGRAFAFIGLDEVAFFSSDGTSNPDSELYQALLPGLATLPGAMIALISTAYARRGLLFDRWRETFGKDDPDALCIVAETPDLNPLIDRGIIERALERDPSAAAAEWMGRFRSDLEAFVSREVVEAAIVLDRHELPPIEGVTYRAFCDPSGGSQDSMTLAIAHGEDDRVVLDLVREVRPPFSPDGVCAEFAAVLKPYRVSSVKGDRYGGAWPVERFREHGIRYEANAAPKSDIYRELLPLLTANRVELLDRPRLSAQLLGLERRTSRAGRDSIDHAPRAHDDLINSVAGACLAAAKRTRPFEATDFALNLSPVARELGDPRISALEGTGMDIR